MAAAQLAAPAQALATPAQEVEAACWEAASGATLQLGRLGQLRAPLLGHQEWRRSLEWQQVYSWVGGGPSHTKEWWGR